MANYERNPAKESYWREAVRRHAASGLSVRDFCRQEQLTESAFYFWRRTLAERDAPPAKQGKPSQPFPPSAARRPTFVPAVIPGATRVETSIVLELHGGRALRLPASTTIERIADLVQALEARGGR